MEIVNSLKISEFLQHNPDATTVLSLWYKILNSVNLKDFEQMRQQLSETFPRLEKLGNQAIFHLSSGSYFIVFYADYKRQKLFIRHIWTRADYERQTLSKRIQNLPRSVGELSTSPDRH